MLDLILFREEKGGIPEIVRESQRRRCASVQVVDEIIDLDKSWRQGLFELEQMRKGFNSINKQVAKLKISGGDASSLIKTTEENRDLITRKEAAVQEDFAALVSKLGTVGNLVHDSVPVSNDEENNAVLLTWGGKRVESYLKDHVELAQLLGIADLKKGAAVFGGGGRQYLKGYAADLSQALLRFSRVYLGRRQYGVVRTPYLMQKNVMAKCGPFVEEPYRVKTGEGEYMNVSTAEHGLRAYHMDDWIHPNELPKRYAAHSFCFGSCGSIQKVEQCCVTKPTPSESWEMLEEMMKNCEEFYQMLKLPYRVVSVVSGALNNAEAKKYVLEAWFPASKTYRELASCSNCTDYQSRMLEIRCGQKKGKEQGKQYCHLLNSTLTATEWTLCCILENYQTETGVAIPEALQPYMCGRTFMDFL